MRSGKELILATKPYAREIPWRSWYNFISAFLLLVGSILGTFFIPNLYAKIGCSIGITIMLIRTFMLFHDFQHHAILHRQPVADVLFSLFGMYMLTPPSIWKRSHDHHHNHNSKLFGASIGSFPIMTRQKFIECSPSERFYYLSVRSPLNMFFAYFSMFMYGMCLQSFLSSPRRHWDSLVVLVFHVTAAVLIFIYSGWIVWFLAFFIPFFISHMLGAYLFYAQHNFPEAKFRNNIEWSYSHAALESSSYMKMNPIWNWITANIGYHHIHHLNSRIPFYRLPEAMKGIPELQNARVTRLHPKHIVACLKLKVWDPDQNKMVPKPVLN